MEFAQIKIEVVPDMPEGEAVVISAERLAEARQAVSERMDVMLRAALGAPMLPPEPTTFAWPPKPHRFDPYGMMAIRNIA